MHDVSSRLYRAALHPDPIADWTRSISELLDTETADLTVFAPSGVAVKAGGVGADGDEGSEEFLQHYQHINPLQRFWQTLRSGSIVRIDDSLIDADLKRSEFYSRYGQYLDQGGGLCMLLQVRTARVLVHASQARKRQAGQYEMDLLASLRDDLVLSFEIAGSFMQASNLMESVIHSLDQKQIGIAILSEDGRIESINASMNELLHAGSVLRVEHDRLVPGSSVRLPELPRLVHRTREKGACGRLSYQDPSGTRRGSVVAYPAPVTFAWEGVNESKVVLLVTDRSHSSNVLAARLRKTYELTQSEVRVACLLLDGKTPTHIAEELGVQANSVRAHLKSIYAKTGTHAQVELLGLLQGEREQGG
ncbi:MAG: helix-turn-helix transcriptional regulator [Pseudomonas sp.]